MKTTSWIARLKAKFAAIKLFASAAHARASSPEVEQVVTDLDLRQKSLVADNQGLSGELNRQLEIATLAVSYNLWIVGRLRLAEFRVGGLRRIPGASGLRIGPERKID